MPSPDPDSLVDDTTLALRVAQAGAHPDRVAEEELCRRLAPRVRLYGLRHLGSEAFADDLMQHVMLTMIERLREGALRKSERLASFVFGICRMVVLDLKRGCIRRERLLKIHGDALAPPEQLQPSLDQARLIFCLERLPERERTVLLLTFYDDMQTEALAKELAISQANVRVIRHRGLDRFRKCVTGETP